MAGDAAPVMLIAGGTGSIGSAIARAAVTAGWRVVIQGRDAERASASAADIAGEDDAAAIAGSLGGADDAAVIVAAAQACFGRLDAVVDCVAAGPSEGCIAGLFRDTTPAAYAAFLDLSAGWLQRLAHAAAPHLAERGGTLVAFVVDAGRFVAPRQALIGAARAATIGFIRNYAIEAARDGIRAHCVPPSYVAGSRSAEAMGSDRYSAAARRAGLGLPTAADIAPLVVFLCGDGAAKITGQVISVNGGLNA